MNKEKTKKVIKKILKIVWIVIGILIALITGLLYIRMYSASGFGVIGLVLLFATGIYALLIYTGITLLFLLIKWIIKRIRKRKKRGK